MVVTAPEYVTKKYNLKALKSLEELVADAVQTNIPVRLPYHAVATINIIGTYQLTINQHAQGWNHAKPIIANPSTYEIIDPSLFGLTRDASINSRITGWMD
ncbi:putative homocitrate synthase protein [Phaeoacremonium minimum UCRPA7]|uniref:Putative homocitrate synthase protein n=1 Tax=Phaeoacremonium minimum (strain UCR-PA7) TaxID=1286976 RepID=R8BVY8_PHAM7|nr:putative homocitrate synthase protein [Phaeoacremonium minimum UCRPA7]EOO03523.1 putative homocitrate synthase protein [Phaeoacremonium minimum UCRPA7]